MVQGAHTLECKKLTHQQEQLRETSHTHIGTDHTDQLDTTKFADQ